MNCYSLALTIAFFSFAFSGIAQQSVVSPQPARPVYSLSINKPKMSRFLEPVPGAGLIKTDHEYIYFWRMNAGQLAAWLEKRTGYCIYIKKKITTEYYSFSIPNFTANSELIAAFKRLGIIMAFQCSIFS